LVYWRVKSTVDLGKSLAGNSLIFSSSRNGETTPATVVVVVDDVDVDV